MHIHIDMTGSQYLTSGAQQQQQQQDSIQVDSSLPYRRTSSSGPPPAVAYSTTDLTPSSAVCPNLTSLAYTMPGPFRYQF